MWWASGSPSLFADKADILAENAQRARFIAPNDNVGEGRIRTVQDDCSASPIHELERSVVVKQHRSNFAIGDILLAIDDRNVVRKNPNILHTVTFHAKCEQIRAVEKLRGNR